ncbi:MAG: glycine zipper 2TM domain-containing protein [Alphaproteobacteria bacterium]|nr:MAG: glycine zipper 2TM domain-containing protein [Alphaproteobacteria bacterium]
MNKTILLTATALVAGVALTGCQSSSWGQKQTVGTVVGAGGGALLGNQFGKGTGNVALTALGAVAGAWLGNEIGSSLDNADRSALMQAENRAYSAPIGQQITWNNPQSGNSGVIVPVRDGQDGSGAYCREFNQSIVVGGQRQNGYGTACRQPDGTWKIVQ